MTKVMWFLRRAPHLTLAEIGHCWRNVHAPDIIADPSPYLRRYGIDLRVEDDAGLAGGPAAAPEWDGIAGQWFATGADDNAVYSRADRPTRADTLAHTAVFQRLVVRDYEQTV